MDASEEGDIRRLLGQLLDPNIRFPTRPRLLPDLHTFRMPDGLGVRFDGAEAPVILRGRLADAALTCLLPQLDGTHTLGDLMESCPPDLPRQTLLRTLSLLHSKGLLVSGGADAAGEREADSIELALGGGADEVLRRQLLFWGRHLDFTRSAGSATEVQRRLATARLVLVGTGLFGTATYDLLARSSCPQVRVLAWNDEGLLSEALDSGTAWAPEVVRLPSTSIDTATAQLRSWLTDADLLVTATCDAPVALFRAINRLTLQQKVPWLHSNMSASQIDIGPCISPYDSACYTCMEMRQASMQDLAIEDHLYQEHLAEERASTERILLGEAVWAASLGASLVVGEVIRILSGIAPPTLVDAVTTVSPISGFLQTSRFRRVPRCPDCYRGEIQPHHISNTQVEVVG
jgi:bacteriocin biosynthesis cyclodehydratase domain-containing protein